MIKYFGNFQEIINETSAYLSKEYYAKFASKLGIVTPNEKDKRLIDDLLTILAGETADFTYFFQKLQMTRGLQVYDENGISNLGKKCKIV